MTRSRRRLQAAALLMFLAAALHLPFLALAFARHGAAALAAAVALSALGWALMGGRRIVAWVAFFALLALITAAAGWLGAAQGLLAALAQVILAIEALALALVFVALWRDPPRRRVG